MPDLFTPLPADDAISLSVFNGRIKETIAYQEELQGQWVKAETSDVQVRRGHCYMELIEKNPDNGMTIAKVQAVVWANVFASLNAQFMNVTGQSFASGMKVLVKVSANFHEQYGLKLIISDINPEFTLGDMARQRREIIERLTREGVIDMNKTLSWPIVPQRIAIVSAKGAAGYGDFMNQLENNPYGIKFYPCLFTAMMQGVNTRPSVLAALARINEHIDLFDCVVIIRGGGSTSDLNSFDDYDLAATIAQFPIPVIVGIGHERDITVLDYVAAMRVKTPTAAAEFLIQRGSDALSNLNELSNSIVSTARDIVARSREQLTYYTSIIPTTARRIIDTNRLRLNNYKQTIPLSVGNRLGTEHTRLSHRIDNIKDAVDRLMMRERMRIEALTDKLTLLSPRNILNRGYSLTILNGKYISNAAQLQPGDIVTTHFANGSARATIQSTKTDNKQQS
ncbi:MAG: exodeoxyribonuclease VII large subunit [Muribaculaceae bacterium]|nr:exodeoxyribonuclease VII large subunit [Muribaculaceae bacterium]